MKSLLWNYLSHILYSYSPIFVVGIVICMLVTLFNFKKKKKNFLQIVNCPHFKITISRHWFFSAFDTLNKYCHRRVLLSKVRTLSLCIPCLFPIYKWQSYKGKLTQFFFDFADNINTFKINWLKRCLANPLWYFIPNVIFHLASYPLP